jgi:hypothetical protein
MNLIKKLIKNNWLRGYTEDTLSYDDLTIKLNERNKILQDTQVKKSVLDWEKHNLEQRLDYILHDFVVLFKFVEQNKLSGTIADNFKSNCVACAITKKELFPSCTYNKECLLKGILERIPDSNRFFFDCSQEKYIIKLQISTSLLDKIEKVRLSEDTKYSHLSWSSTEFIEWMENEKLEKTDFNYIFGSDILNQYPEIIKAAKKRKKELNKKVGVNKRKESVFLNKNDDFTWYIKNISENHVALSDLDIVINRGRSENLLEKLKEKQIINSDDLKKQLNLNNLKRLTEKEYLFEIKKYLLRHPIKTGIK